MQMKTTLLLTAMMAAGLPLSSAQAGSLETLNNPVSDGAITVVALDPDRTDWDGLTPYQDDLPGPDAVLSYGNITIAHDSTSVFLRMQMDAIDPLDPDQSFFGAHHSLLIDIDQDPNTGYRGGDGVVGGDDFILPIGADILVEGPAVWTFGTFVNPGGANQEVWTWGNLVPWGGVPFDDSPPSDIEIELLRSNLSDTEAFDFVAITTRTELIDGVPTFVNTDIYPNAGTLAAGDFFTYDMNFVDVGIDGDLDGDGFVGINDLNIVLAAWNQSVPPADPAADPSGDGFVGIDDLNAVLGNWNAGTPPTGGAAVPEPTTLALLGLGGAALIRRRA